MAGCVIVDEPDIECNCSRRQCTAALCTQWCKPIPPCLTQEAAFCSYSSHSNGCIDGMATTSEEGSRSQCWHFIEGGREGDWTRHGGFGMQIEEKIIQFLSVEHTCAALEGDQVYTPSIKGGKAKEIPSCPS
jgi:hypothetical protein